MKRFGFITLAVLTAVFFSSCNDSDGDYASSWAFASAETLSNDYYFVLDDDKTVYPSDKSRVAGYKPRRRPARHHLLQPAENGSRGLRLQHRALRRAEHLHGRDQNRDHAGRGGGTTRRANQLFRQQHERQLAQRGNRIQRFGPLEA